MLVTIVGPNMKKREDVHAAWENVSYNLSEIMDTHIFEIRGRCILQYIFSICNLLSFGERERDKTM